MSSSEDDEDEEDDEFVARRRDRGEEDLPRNLGPGMFRRYEDLAVEEEENQDDGSDEEDEELPDLEPVAGGSAQRGKF